MSTDFLEHMQDDGFTIKDEFHVTVVPGEVGRDLTDLEYQRVVRFMSQLALPAIEYDDSVYHIDRPKVIGDEPHQRESLVVPVGSAALAYNLTCIRQVIGPRLADPFLHVTLATRPDTIVAARGIGITDARAWKRLDPKLYAENWQA